VSVQDAAPATSPTPEPVETVSEKYLRHIRNVVVAAFVIWIVGAVVGGIAYVAITVHDHNVAKQNACSLQGRGYSNGLCLPPMPLR